MRFRVRHVQQTFADMVEAGLTSLGWMGGPTALWGTPAVELLEVEPDGVKDFNGRQVVAVTAPTELSAEDAELGGLLATTIPLYVDVYGVRPSVTMSIASDIRDLLDRRTVDVLDHTQTPPAVSGVSAEVERLTIDRPPQSYGATDFKRNWRVIELTLRVYYVPTA